MIPIRRSNFPARETFPAPLRPVVLWCLLLAWTLTGSSVRGDSVVVFNEVHYHPATNEALLEWVELQNQQTVDMDLSGWSLAGGVRFRFPEGTVLPGRGYLVIASSPPTLRAQAPEAQILGPFEGRLNNGGQRLELRNNSLRLMDELNYGTDDPWPVAADGLGASLARRRSFTASGEPASWTFSAQVGGTPGRENFPRPAVSSSLTPLLGLATRWRYADQGQDLGEAWRQADYDDSAWKTGEGAFGIGGDNLPVAVQTRLQPGAPTYYFRTRFDAPGDPARVQLLLRTLVDDGALVFLNGVELVRANLPNGSVGFVTSALAQIGVAGWSESLGLSSSLLRPTGNVLAVEVHQAKPGAGYAQTVLDSGPVGYWRLGEKTAKASDLSGRGGFNDGTYTRFLSSNLGQSGPRPTNSIASKPLEGFESTNAAPRFAGNADAGNDVVLIPDPGVFDFAENRTFSLEAWVKGAATQESGAAILAKGTGGGGEQYALDVVDGKYRFFAWNGGTPNVPTVLSSPVGPSGDWQHLVAVFDGTAAQLRFYVNGLEQGIAVAPATLVRTTHELSIGSRQSQAGNYDLNFDGWIDEVAVYDRVLPPSEVTSHFAAAFAGGGQVDPLVEDLTFALELGAREVKEAALPLGLRLNEVAPGGAPGSWVELFNLGDTALDLTGYSLQRLGASGFAETRLDGRQIPPFGFLTVEPASLGFLLEEGDRLGILAERGAKVLDAVRVASRVRGRTPDGVGGWGFPAEATPGATNVVRLRAEVVINEIQYHRHPIPSQPAVVSNLVTVPFNQPWKYNAEARDLGTTWRAPEFDDGAWLVGAGVFYAPNSFSSPVTRGTLIPLAPAGGGRVITAYFRTQFNFQGPTNGLVLALKSVLDDGAVIYLNGVEIYRTNLPPAEITYATLATVNVGPITRPDELLLPGVGLRQGQNTLAVEVHQVVGTSPDLVFGLEFGVARLLRPSSTFQEEDESWIELHNRSDAPVSLAGWQLEDGVRFTFAPSTSIPPQGYLVVARDPQAFRTRYPTLSPAGPFAGRLAQGSERIALRDASGNLADEVRYFDSGRWPAEADGAGSTLELKDPRADNASPEAWAASQEASGMEWRTYRWRGLAQPGQAGEPDLWHELALGLTDGAGVVDVDDISVIESPSGTAKELVANGKFDGGSFVKWRFLGNHRHSRVVVDPSDPSNHVLRVISSGAAEYQGNQIECTFTNNLAIVNGREYEISFRARWRSGANHLNLRLYFNRLARTFQLDRPERPGTPGARNSVWTSNLGPTFESLRHFPVVPEAGQPVLVSAQAVDPDGVRAVTLRYQISGSDWSDLLLQPVSGSRFEGAIPGAKAGNVVQFYLIGQDSLGAESRFPAAGEESRALYVVRDSQPISQTLQQFRIIMLPSDASFLHTSTNTLSNELLGATVVANESDVYYDVGVRLKGSFVGRNVSRVGFHVGFHAEQPFRGVHRVVSVDRSQHAQTGGLAELVTKHVATHAGGIPGMYDDIEQFLAPLPSYSLIAGIRLSGFDNDSLDSQFVNGAEGPLYEVEVHRWNVATVDGKPDSPKAVGNESSGTGYADFEMQDYGNYGDNYRWNYLQVNNRARDDYRRVIQAAQVLGLSGVALDAAVDEVLDVDAWLRVMAFQQLVGPADAYFTGGAVHNFRVYVRPEDEKVLYLPWDWDSSFMASPDASLTGNGNIGKLLTNQNRRRAFYEHLHDLISTTFNAAYLTRWTTHYGSLAQQNMADILTYVRSRSTSVLNQLPRTNAFRITQNGGNGFATNAAEIVLTGTAPISVHSIRYQGQLLALTWTSASAWRAVIGLGAGENLIQLEGLDRAGVPLTNALASLVVTNTGPAALRPIVINEWMADNAGPDGVADPVDGLFQDWIELYNPNAVPVDLSGYYLSDSPLLPTKWQVPTGVEIAGHGYRLVWADNQPEQNGKGPQGDLHAAFQLNAEGESLSLVGPDGVKVLSSVTFARQLQNISQGRAVDGVAEPIVFQSRATPRGPNAGARLLRIVEAVVLEGSMLLRWTAEPGKTYRVESRPAWDESGWDLQGTLLGGGNPVLEFSQPTVGSGERFYRIRQDP